MAHQLSRPALAMQGRRGLWPLCLCYLSVACLPLGGLRTARTGSVPSPHPSPPPAKLGEGMYCGSTPLPPTPLGEGWDGGWQHPSAPLVRGRTWWLFLALALSSATAAHADNRVREGVPPPKHKWTKFVTVAGQPEPVPAEWVSTPEGQYAHSIVIPNPVPKDSGYRWWWSAKKYFLHLCEKEAGEFVFKTVDNVEGFLFMRPPKRPTDFDLKDRFKLEAPNLERLYRSYREDIRSRGRHYVSPGRLYLYLEEVNSEMAGATVSYLKASSYDTKQLGLVNVEVLAEPTSRYAVTWRGLRRTRDRENGISGSEFIVLDRTSNEVAAVWRDFGLTNKSAANPSDVWWLNAAICPKFYNIYARPDIQQPYGFISSTLHPKQVSGAP